MSAGIPPPSENPLNPEYSILVEGSVRNHHEFRHGPEISPNPEMMVSPPQKSTASKQSVFQNNIALQAELERIQDEERVLGLQLSDFRHSGTEDDFDSESIDVRELLSSLRLMRAKSQTQYRTVRRRKRETDNVSPEPTTAESENSEENKIAILGSLRIAKVPVRRTYQEPRGPSKRKGGRKSKDSKNSSSARQSSPDQSLPL
ncbi:hypothetical protein L873DRAFT_1786229 [Choiromyces venosus 120613-1]|uniref:Uncharacterized protein n=1 Tax=Choiromyces venosus 120613-1 TaxID=1336337 RepID=A0A3N4K5B8_9PEZI|nr:hypothetical protein L873DRAFT_1786229 [Choiromyces venosus 120613-1]